MIKGHPTIGALLSKWNQAPAFKKQKQEIKT